MCSKGCALACLIHDLIFPLVTSHTISIQTDSFYLVHTIQIHCLYNIITHVPVGEGATTYRNKTGSLSTTHVLHPRAHSIFTPSHLTCEIFVRPMSWKRRASCRWAWPNNKQFKLLHSITEGTSSFHILPYNWLVLRNHTPLLHVVLRDHTHYYMTMYDHGTILLVTSMTTPTYRCTSIALLYTYRGHHIIYTVPANLQMNTH